MKRLLLVMGLVVTSFAFIMAQRTISGTVIDDTGEPLIGASVQAKGTTVGVFTDIDGGYTINVPSSVNTVVVSFTGYETQELMLGASNIVDVTLTEGVTLEAAVVTALGIERSEKALGYATQKVDGESLVKARETNVINSLAGKVAGVQITGSSNLGGSAKIVIRGNNSILGSNDPLFVVDGAPIDNFGASDPNQRRGAGGYDWGNAAQDINPDDIESIEVLKGAAATALYGSRGSNGVVMITTKKGTKRSGIGISINSGVSFQNVAVLPDYQNEYGGGAGDQFFTLDNGQLAADYGYDGSWGPKLDGTNVRHWDSWFNDGENGTVRPWSANPDNIKDFFRTGVTSNQSIAFAGGDEKTTYRLSYTNLSQNGTQENSNLQRNTLSLNASSKIAKNFTTSVSANLVNSKGIGRPQTGYNEGVMSQFNQWFQRQLDMDRLRNYKNEDGTQRTWNPNDAPNGDLTPHYWDNPFWERYENTPDDNRNRIFGNITFNYDITPKVAITGRVNNDSYTDERRERVAVGGVRIPRFSEDVRRRRETNYEGFVTYQDRFANALSLTAIGGVNRRDNVNHRNFASTRDGLKVPGLYTVTNSAGAFDIRDYTAKKRVNSIYGSVSLGYGDFIYLDVTGRNDWSSTLPSHESSFFYPSVSTSFVFSEFINASDVFSFGKIRLAWAQVGNDTDPYRVNTTFTGHDNFGSDGLFSVANDLNNLNLKPEKTNSFEVGTDLRFFKNRIGIDFTYYDNLTKDLIFPVDQSGASGNTSRYLNAGEVSNKGVELALTLRPVQTSTISWDIGFNWAQNKNKVEKLYKDPDSGIEIDQIRLTSLFGVELRAAVGESLWTFYGTDYTYDDNGNRLVDANGTYITTASPQALGSTQADFTGGVNTTFAWKGLSLFGLIDFQKGGSIHSYSNQWGKYSGTLAETVENNIREDGIVVEGVYAPGTVIDGNDVSGQANTTNISAAYHYYINGGYIVNSVDQYDASFVKLRELRLTYDFNTTKLFKGKIQGLAVSLVGRNIAILSKNVPHIDPEAGLSLSNVQGFEGGQLPTERSLGINLNLKF